MTYSTYFIRLLLISLFLLALPVEVYAVDSDSDGSADDEETLAGTDLNNPNERPYWWKTIDTSGSRTVMGKLDEDEYPDFLTNTYSDNGSSVGSISAVSGLDDSVLFTVYADASHNNLGTSKGSVGDINNDGINDFFGGGGEDYYFYVRFYSGANGGLLHTIVLTKKFQSFGEIGNAGDLNDDQYNDIYVHTKGNENINAGNPTIERVGDFIHIYSGRDGTILRTFDPTDFGTDYSGNPSKVFTSVANAGDANNDGLADLIVGYSSNKIDDSTNVGTVWVLSGANGTVLHTINGSYSPQGFGKDVEGLGDINEDGHDDFAIVNEERSYIQLPVTGTVYSGKDASVLYDFETEFDRAIFIQNVGDLNLDGFNELIIGSPLFDSPSNVNNVGGFKVISGKDGKGLFSFYGKTDGAGLVGEGLGDFDLDGYGDLLVNDDDFTRIVLYKDLIKDVDLDYSLNIVDEDDDNDGVLDVNDAFPFDASRSVAESNGEENGSSDIGESNREKNGFSDIGESGGSGGGGSFCLPYIVLITLLFSMSRLRRY